MAAPSHFPIVAAAHSLPATFSLISANNGIIADLYRRANRIEAVVLSSDPATLVTLSGSGPPRVLAPAPLMITSVEVASP